MKILKSIFILISGLLSGLYLLNIGAGIVEIIPDNVPAIGNLDEFITSLILLKSFAYFDFDLRTKPLKKPGQQPLIHGISHHRSPHQLDCTCFH